MDVLSTASQNRSPAMWDPFSAFVEMRRHMDEFMNGVLSQQCSSGAGWRPAIDVDEDEHSFTIRIEVPGWGERDVSAEIDQHVLTIRGQRGGDNTRETTVGRTQSGRREGSFIQSLSLPPTIDAEHISAQIERGLLSVHLPKKAQVVPRRIAITNAARDCEREPAGG